MARKATEIAIDDVIDVAPYGFSGGELRKTLAKIPKDHELDIFINSPGGSVFEGMSIYDQFKRWPKKKNVHIDGMAASIASVIAMAGDTRSIAENGMMMIHDPSTFGVGTAEDFRKTADLLDKITVSILKAYSSVSNVESAKFRQMMLDETWFDADQAIKLGLCNTKSGTADISAKIANESYGKILCQYKNTPKHLVRADSLVKEQLARMQMCVSRLRRESGPQRNKTM